MLENKNEHRLTILLGILGLIISLTIMMSVAYSMLFNNETLTTKLQKTDSAAAAEEK